MRWRVREGAFSYGRTWSTSWDARDTHRAEVLFLHRNRSRLLALITAVPESIETRSRQLGESTWCGLMGLTWGTQLVFSMLLKMPAGK